MSDTLEDIVERNKKEVNIRTGIVCDTNCAYQTMDGHCSLVTILIENGKCKDKYKR